MTTIKDFIKSRKLAQLRENLIEGKMPEQGTYITLFNNDYKVLTQPDSKICILEDIKANKFAYPREKLLAMLSKSLENNELEKADGPRVLSGPNRLVAEIGENVKSPSSNPPVSGNMKKEYPVGTIRNGRKKVVSKRTGKTMWVNIVTGEAHDSHEESSPKQAPEEDVKREAEEKFNQVKDKLHPADRMKIQQQMGELIELHHRVMNMLDTAHQDDRSRSPAAAFTRKKVFFLQDQYKFAMDKFKQDVIASVKRRKMEGL
jgi:hypothetical protein